jgi:hypothetical protein
VQSRNDCGQASFEVTPARRGIAPLTLTCFFNSQEDWGCSILMKLNPDDIRIRYLTMVNSQGSDVTQTRDDSAAKANPNDPQLHKRHSKIVVGE